MAFDQCAVNVPQGLHSSEFFEVFEGTSEPSVRAFVMPPHAHQPGAVSQARRSRRSMRVGSSFHPELLALWRRIPKNSTPRGWCR